MSAPTLEDRKLVIERLFSLLHDAELSVGVASKHLNMSRQVLYKYQRSGVPNELYERFTNFCNALTSGLASGDLPVSKRLIKLDSSTGDN